MSRILVTGCSGFLASHLLKLLQREPRNKIFGITEVPGFIYPDIEVFQVDIRRRGDIAQMLEIIRPDITFHLAAVASVGFAWKNPEITYDVNFMGSSNLLEALQASAPDSRLLLMSTAEIYQPSEKPINERSPIVCQNPYALSKLAMEMLGDLYWRAFGMKVCKIRAFNFTGPGQDRKFVAADFASQIARRGTAPGHPRRQPGGAPRFFRRPRRGPLRPGHWRQGQGRRDIQCLFGTGLFHSPDTGYPAGPGEKAHSRRGRSRQVPSAR
jgi:GDP-4-dehydro-6-deoxy-D-mannose reductase